MCSRNSLSAYLFSVLEELTLVEGEICQNFPACFTLRREMSMLKEEGEKLKVLTQPFDEILEHSASTSNFFNFICRNFVNPQQQRQKNSEFRQNMEKIHCLRRNIQFLKTLLAREVEKKNLCKKNDGYSCSESESSSETNQRTGNYSPNCSEVSSVSNSSSYYYQFF